MQKTNLPLSEQARASVELFLSDFQDEKPSNVYKVVMEQVEKPLLETIMVYCRGNQSEATRLLGINRGTLRKKLAYYDLD